MNDNDDDDKVKKLLAGAHDAGALSAKSLATLDVVDVGAQIQAGLGVTIDDVAASEVVLLTMMPDDSQSIAAANNTEAVRDGHNFVLDALAKSKQSGEVLAQRDAVRVRPLVLHDPARWIDWIVSTIKPAHRHPSCSPDNTEHRATRQPRHGRWLPNTAEGCEPCARWCNCLVPQ